MRPEPRTEPTASTPGAFISKTGTALAEVAKSRPADTPDAGDATHAAAVGSGRQLECLKTRAAADQWRAQALSRAVGRARARLAADQRAIAAENAARVAQASAAL